MSHWLQGHQLQDGRYVIQELLGKGGFGVAYRALDTKLERDIVIKTLNPELKTKLHYEKFQKDFVEEAQRLSKCVHPNIVPIYDIFGTEDDMPCIVIEYIEGETLEKKVVNQGFLKSEVALNYIKQIGNALNLVHQKGYLHRDVKPSNILIRAGSDDAILIDFGIARKFDLNEPLSCTLAVTHGYAPPEQYSEIKGQAQFTDVYGLAATLYFTLTAITPMPSLARREAYLEHKNDPLSEPNQINSLVSESVNHAILLGMRLSKSERPQSISAWLDLLFNSSSNIVDKNNNQNQIQNAVTLVGDTIPDNHKINVAQNLTNRKKDTRPNWKFIGYGLGVILLIGSGAAIVASQKHLFSNPFVQDKVQKEPCQQQGILTICRSIADVPDVPALTRGVRFAGATTFAPLNTPKVINLIKKYHPQFQLNYIRPEGERPSSSTGIYWLIEGLRDINFTQSSLPMAPEAYQSARAKNFELKEIPVAYNIKAIYVNSGLTAKELPGLTLEQLQKIFTGEITNWQQVGGPNLEIKPMRVRRQAYLNLVTDEMQQRVFKKPYAKNVQEVATPTLTKRAVATTPGSISFMTFSELVNQKTVPIRILPIAKDVNSPFVSPCGNQSCNVYNKNIFVDKSYPEELIGNIYVIIKDDKGFNKQVGIAYANMLLSDEGQKLVAEAGFVPLRFVP